MYPYEKKHLELQRPYLGECMVLLKKDGSFPLPSPCKIAAYGSGVRNTVKGGTGSGEVNSRFSVNVEEGLEKAGFEITTKAWLDAYDAVYSQAKLAFREEIKRRAKEHHTMAVMEGMGAVMPEPEYELELTGSGDAAIYVLSRICGEGNDRQAVKGDVYLSDTELRDILALNEKFHKFMLVLNVGGPVDLSPLQEVKNILVLSQLGVETGSALASILLGETVPSGKLTTTWTKYEDYCAIGSMAEKDDTLYEEGIYVGYRYFDTVGKKPLYPFGFGLGYGEFSLEPAGVKLSGTKVSVGAKIKNTGAYKGKETAQVYVSCPQGKLDKPYQVLAGFKKSPELARGGECTVEVIFDMKDIASYDAASAAWILEKGDYILRLGTSSASTEAAAVIRLDGDAVVRKVKNLLDAPSFKDWVPAAAEYAAPEKLKVLKLSASAISGEKADYTPDTSMEPEIEKLSDEELAYLNIGLFDPKAGLASVIGDASQTVPGAAGEASSVFNKLGVKPLVMSDGPAGLRISKKYFSDKSGKHSMGETMPATIAEYLPKAVTAFMGLMAKKPGRNAVIHDQYATTIPIGTAIAQSWNTDFAEICGDIVGTEMERFGVHLWLAPALNIHRSILCGRNFEYYSEDPLISGVFAAAVTKGVQKHPGCGVTIKHYAANNQETNRYANNSRVSERAMREIYLKGFEICVKEADPASVMTSYNLLNGVHTSERRDLTTDILMCEFGFKGAVMTDWVISVGMISKDSKYGAPDPAKVAAAGCSFYMPGSKKDWDSMLAGLKSGTVTRQQLIINATRALNLSRRLQK